MATPTEYLCKGFPTEFVVFFQYVRSLRFDDKPDYAYLRKLFRDLFVREGEGAAAWPKGRHRGCTPCPAAAAWTFCTCMDGPAVMLPRVIAARGRFSTGRAIGGAGLADAPGSQLNCGIAACTRLFPAHATAWWPRLLKHTTDASFPHVLRSRPAGFTWDYVFDWTILKYAQQQNSRPSSSRPADGGYAGGQAARGGEDTRDAEAALRKLGLQ